MAVPADRVSSVSSSVQPAQISRPSPGHAETGEAEDDAGVTAYPSSDEFGPPLEVIAADEESAQGAAPAPARTILPRAQENGEGDEDAPPKTTPSLDALVERIPAAVRETLEELFRARFVKVVRVPKSALTTEKARAGAKKTSE